MLKKSRGFCMVKNNYNKGEWSELYSFIKLLKEGKIYTADENANRIVSQYLPIIKLIRNEEVGIEREFYTGDEIKIFENGELIATFNKNNLNHYIDLMLTKLFDKNGHYEHSGAFPIPEIETLMKDLHIKKVKASSAEKIDINMQIQDINTGYSPIVGFSIKSDIGSPPTLLNAGKNTRIRYRINNISDNQIKEFNSIDKAVVKEYMKARIEKLKSYNLKVEFDKILDSTFEDNLIMIDSSLPHIYAEMILQHYLKISDSIYDCSQIVNILIDENPLKYRRTDIYKHKFKKLICASALGMTPGKPWDGLDSATGGYIIIKKDGDVLCYHLYNRNFFEEYLLSNTRFDRPSATRYDYGYIYKENNVAYIDLNVQIRFKSIR